jgi:VIT1/CCC1 family predicted Fe2+/Mn2+ transporter
MEWKNLSDIVGKSAPILGTLLGGPAGAAIGAIISSALGVENSPEEIKSKLEMDPALCVKLAEIESTQLIRLQELALENSKSEISAASQNISEINETFRQEIKAEHWIIYSWRPAIGFSVAIAIVLSLFCVFFAYFSAMFLGRNDFLLNLPGILTAIAGIIGVVLPILGINSWFHGKALADPTNQAVTK